MGVGAARAVFLSYRREETRHIAGRLADRLGERLGPDQVFMDVDTIEAGADFAAAIAREVASSSILIALIGSTWLMGANQWGQRRIDDPDDIVVLEILTALEGKIHIIPVLVDGATMPNRADLPERLQDLTRRNAVRLDHDTFRSDVTILLNAVDRILPTLSQKATEETEGSEIGLTDRAVTANKDHLQQTPETNNLDGPLTGQRNVADAHHPPSSTSPITASAPTWRSRSRSRLLIAAVIVITASVAGSIILLATDDLPKSGAPSLTTQTTASSPLVGNHPPDTAVAPDGRGSDITNHDTGSGPVGHPRADEPPLTTAPKPEITVSTITVGKNPSSLAVAPDGRRVYVTNRSSGSVSVIDAGGSTVTAIVPVGNGPAAVAVSPDGLRVYVTNHYSESVSVIDAGSNTVIATVPVGRVPAGVVITPDGRRVYVNNYYSDSVSVIDTGSNTVIATVPVGQLPSSIAASSDGRRVYVNNYENNSVSAIDTRSNTVVGTIAVSTSPFAVAVSPNGRRVYVTNDGSSSVSVIDADSNKVASIVPVGNGPSGLLVSPDGGLVYVANRGSSSVSVIDASNNKVTAVISVGNGPSNVVASPDGDRIYVTNYDSESVSVIDPKQS